MNAPQWLRNLIVDGLQGLLVLRLRGAPAADTVKAVANAWVTVIASRPIAWDEDLDAERVRRAFVQLASTAEYWPAPAMFLESLAPRQPAAVPMLERPQTREIPPAVKAQLARFLNRSKA